MYFVPCSPVLPQLELEPQGQSYLWLNSNCSFNMISSIALVLAAVPSIKP